MKNRYIILGFLLLIACQILPTEEKSMQMMAWEGMEPLIQKGEMLEIIQSEEYARNDVVGLLQKEVEADSLIMIPCRIVGLPGESIKMEDGKIFIDGQEYLDPPEVNFPYVLRSESIDSSFFEYHQIQRYGFAIGDFWQANLNHAQLSIVENEPQIEQVIFSMRHILGENWVVGKTVDNSWGKINWGPIKIPNVGDKVV